MARRILVAVLAALVFASALTLTALAVTYSISEYSSNFGGWGGLTNLTACPAGWICQDNNAKYVCLEPNPDAGGTWYAKAAGTTWRYMEWYAFIPNNGTGNNFAAVKYKIVDRSGGTETYYTVVNQTTWKGQYVYLGSLNNGSSQSYLYLNNKCVPGYACSITLNLYFDKAKFTY